MNCRINLTIGVKFDWRFTISIQNNKSNLKMLNNPYNFNEL